MQSKIKVSLIVFIFLSLCSFPTVGKKLYKFQDKQGHWNFTDKPPTTEQKILVEQLDVKNKQRIWVLQSGEKQQPTYYIRNDYSGPVEVDIIFSIAENAYSIPQLPHRFIVQSGQSGNLFQIHSIDKTKPWRVEFKYNYTIGMPLAEYISTKSYLPPIALGSSFHISQAFGGTFSHTEEYNKYAVDITMPIGTPIHAARDGIVMAVDNDFYKNGIEKKYLPEANQIIILHDDDSMAIYAHLELEKAQVHSGMKVKAGQLIAYSGNTGFSSGPHLHFAIQVNKGMKLVSLPFKFINSDAQAEEPVVGGVVSRKIGLAERVIDPSVTNNKTPSSTTGSYRAEQNRNTNFSTFHIALCELIMKWKQISFCNP
jgi:murein DD-endopeptidase MepM/ murein hydrolase activator NlpD